MKEINIKIRESNPIYELMENWVHNANKKYPHLNFDEGSFVILGALLVYEYIPDMSTHLSVEAHRVITNGGMNAFKRYALLKNIKHIEGSLFK